MAYQLEFGDLLPHAGRIAQGALLTLELTATSVALGLLLGVLGALCRASRFAFLSWPAAAYVELIRNTPFLVQLFFLFFGLPSLGLKLTALQAALLAMTINLGAYSTEIIRAGVESVARGQMEAGLSLGLTRLQVFRYVILPPALQNVYPALSSQFVLMLLGSSVVSQISVEELTFAANFVQSRNFRSVEVYFVVTVLYLVMAVVLRAALGRLSRLLFPPRTSQ